MAGGKATAPMMLPGIAPPPTAQPLLPPPGRRRSRRDRNHHRGSDSRKSRRHSRKSRARSRSRRSGRSGRNRREASSSSFYSYDDDDDNGVDAAESTYVGSFWQGSALPRGCTRYGLMPPPIVYEIAHILLPKKFTISMLSAHPDFQKNTHRDMLIPVVCALTGQSTSNRIPSMLRKQPKLFFQGFEQLKTRAAKVFKENPDLGSPVATAEGAAVAAATASSAAIVAQVGAGDSSDLVAKAVLAKSSRIVIDTTREC